MGLGAGASCIILQTVTRGRHCVRHDTAARPRKQCRTGSAELEEPCGAKSQQVALVHWLGCPPRRLGTHRMWGWGGGPHGAAPRHACAFDAKKQHASAYQQPHAACEQVPSHRCWRPCHRCWRGPGCLPFFRRSAQGSRTGALQAGHSSGSAH